MGHIPSPTSWDTGQYYCYYCTLFSLSRLFQVILILTLYLPLINGLRIDQMTLGY